jgi:hypothetical protein
MAGVCMTRWATLSNGWALSARLVMDTVTDHIGTTVHSSTLPVYSPVPTYALTFPPPARNAHRVYWRQWIRT